jgi:DNA-directed RNA polymerase II subunit RPB2
MIGNKMDNKMDNKRKEIEKPKTEKKELEKEPNPENPENPWTIINAYFSNQHLQQLVRHQIESFNDFITRQIPDTIVMFNPVQISSEHDYDKESGKYALEIYINFDNFGIYRPQIHENNGATKLMFPQEARLRNFTYASNMTIDINIKYVIRTGNMLENIQTIYKTMPKIHIGKIPIMLRSNVCILTHYKHITPEVTGECKLDTGGYFIINGSEKTCLAQERAAENRIYCFNVSKTNCKWSHTAEIKSVPDWKCISPKQIAIMVSVKNNGYGHSIWIQIPRIKQPIPLIILFRALGIISDKEICEKIVLDIDDPNNKKFIDNLKASIVEANNYICYESAIKYITSHVIYTPLNMDKETGLLKKREFAFEILKNDLFPHCRNKTQQIYFLGYMTLKLLKCYNGLITVDDRDSYLNKRVDLTGALLNNLFRNYFNKLVKDMQKQIIREINNGSWRSS